MKLRFVFFVAVFSLISCVSHTVDLAIDNPTDSEILVTVDSLHVAVPSSATIRVEMGKGMHKIRLLSGEETWFDFQDDFYFINPTLTSYIQVPQQYGSEYNLLLPMHRTVRYMDFELQGDYKVVDKLINRVTWDYWPRERLPQIVEVAEDEQSTTVYKLMQPSEFGAMVNTSINKD